MPERPDLRQIAGNIREALADYDRDALAEILAYVFKEYVVQSPPPLLVNQTERIDDLEGLSFAELITTLQTRLDLPELSAFQVHGEQVLVRAGGVLTPVEATDTRAAMSPPPPSAPAQRPEAATDGPVETTLIDTRASAAEAAARGRGDLAGQGGPAVVQAPPPRPGGLRVSSRPAGAGAGAGAAAPTPPEQPNPPDDKKPDTDPDPDPDDASVRFSLLELD